jgi:3-aminobutyryl-CoA ammonia-lyase
VTPDKAVGEAPEGESGSESRGQSSREPGSAADAAPGEVGFTVAHRRYVPQADAHYGGSLVDGAYVLGLFGDAATELCLRGDGDEGLFASYSDVQFRAPVLAGDVLEVTARLARVGRRSREITFEARVTCRARRDRGASAGEVLDPPLTVTTARGIVVVPAHDDSKRSS